MATIDYKDKYEKAVHAAMLAKQDTESAVTIGILEEIFPELKESEGEKTKKEILDYIIKGSESCYDVQQYGKEKFKKWITWLEKQGEKGTNGNERKIPNSEQKPAWSEKYIADVFEKVGLAKIVREQENDALTEALQSAMIELSKYSVVPQIRQEWSEEDERNLDWLITVCERIHYKSDPQVSTESALMLRDWLKSLRPQNTWKPSIAQLNALSIVSKGYVSDDIEAIASLYNDLKKLREE